MISEGIKDQKKWRSLGAPPEPSAISVEALTNLKITLSCNIAGHDSAIRAFHPLQHGGMALCGFRYEYQIRPFVSCAVVLSKELKGYKSQDMIDVARIYQWTLRSNSLTEFKSKRELDINESWRDSWERIIPTGEDD